MTIRENYIPRGAGSLFQRQRLLHPVLWLLCARAGYADDGFVHAAGGIAGILDPFGRRAVVPVPQALPPAGNGHPYGDVLSHLLGTAPPSPSAQTSQTTPSSQRTGGGSWSPAAPGRLRWLRRPRRVRRRRFLRRRVLRRTGKLRRRRPLRRRVLRRARRRVLRRAPLNRRSADKNSTAESRAVLLSLFHIGQQLQQKTAEEQHQRQRVRSTHHQPSSPKNVVCRVSDKKRA